MRRLLRLWNRRRSTLFAYARGKDIPGGIGGKRRDFLLRRTVQHESLTSRRDAIDQPAAIRSCDYRTQSGCALLAALSFFLFRGWPHQSKTADMGLVTLEKNRPFSRLLDLENLSVIAGRHVHRSCRIEFDVPDVFRFWIEEDR